MGYPIIGKRYALQALFLAASLVLTGCLQGGGGGSGGGAGAHGASTDADPGVVKNRSGAQTLELAVPESYTDFNRTITLPKYTGTLPLSAVLVEITIVPLATLTANSTRNDQSVSCSATATFTFSAASTGTLGQWADESVRTSTVSAVSLLDKPVTANFPLLNYVFTREFKYPADEAILDLLYRGEDASVQIQEKVYGTYQCFGAGGFSARSKASANVRVVYTPAQP